MEAPDSSRTRRSSSTRSSVLFVKLHIITSTLTTARVGTDGFLCTHSGSV